MHLKFDKLIWLIARCFMMLDMLVVASGCVHRIVWLSSVRFCTRYFVMESCGSYFASNNSQLNNALIKMLFVDKKEL